MNGKNDTPRSIVMTQVMTPDMVNFSGNIHGGYLMQFLDHTAYVCATNYCKSRTSTRSVDSLNFQRAVHVGELVTSYASINRVGRTSMEVGIRAEAQNLFTGERRHVISAYFTFVAIDEKTGKPKPVPALIIENEQQQKRLEAAKLRVELRTEYETRHQAIREKYR